MPRPDVQLGSTGSSGGDERLRALADNLTRAMIYQLSVMGSERRFTYVSGGVEAIFGLDPEAVLADAALLYKAIAPDFLPALAAAEAKSLETGTRFEQEVAISRPDGTAAWVQITSVRRPGGGDAQVWDGIVLDITASKVAEQRFRDSERRLELATSAADIGIWDWDLVTGEIVYSRRAKEICGFPPENPVTVPMIRAITHPEDHPWTSELARRAIDPATRGKQTYRYRIVRPDSGEIRWVLAYGEARFSEAGGVTKCLSYAGTIQDITEQKQAEEALAESAARMQLAVEAAHMAVWEVNLDTNAITHSPELNRLYGLPDDARPSYEDLRRLHAPGERERTDRESAATLARGETRIQFEFKHFWPDGSERWLQLRAQPAPPTATIRRRAVGILIDITERKRAEERLALVARELQHRVKNSLAIVQTLATMSLRGKTNREAALDAFVGRLQALAAVTDALGHGESDAARLRQVVEKAIQPYREQEADPFTLAGPDLEVPSRVATAIGMALHELSTNAVKYGSLSQAEGRVSITWSGESGGRLVLDWRETGGPPVTAPLREGFGTRLLQRGLFAALAGRLELGFPETGAICRIELPLP